MNELALYTGGLGGVLATKWLLGWKTICYVEWEQYCIDLTIQRIKDGLLDDAPIWDDARTFDGRPWAGCVGIVTAGFPCPPYSTAGKRQGRNDERNLWPDTIRIIGEIKPEWVLLENVPGLLQDDYVQQIFWELAESGYDCRWDCISAAALGYDHRRERVWIIAHANSKRRERVLCDHAEVSQAPLETSLRPVSLGSVWGRLARLEKELGEPSVFGADDGLSYRVAQLTAAGNAQVPAMVATVWRLLTTEASITP